MAPMERRGRSFRELRSLFAIALAAGLVAGSLGCGKYGRPVRVYERPARGHAAPPGATGAAGAATGNAVSGGAVSGGAATGANPTAPGVPPEPDDEESEPTSRP